MWCRSMGEVEREAGRINAAELMEQVNSYRSFVERGEKDKAVLAVEYCLSFGLPIPEWLEGEVRAAMRYYFDKGGARKGRGSKGNQARTTQARKDAERYRVIERERARSGATLDIALVAAERALSGTFARGSKGQLEDSYKRMAAIYPAERRKPGPKPKSGKSVAKDR